MKQSYTKPAFSLMLFSAAQPGARDCSDIIPKENLTYGDIANCAWDLGGTLFFVSAPACEENGDASGIICYNAPSEGNYIFRS